MALGTNSSSCIPILLLISLFFIPSHCSNSDQTSSSRNANDHMVPGATLFVFGDSFSDPGNNNFINTSNFFQANFSPYGETYFKYPTGRFSDGRLMPDFIAEYAKLPLVPGFLNANGHTPLGSHGLNFASSGAGALEETWKGLVISLKSQLGFFNEAVEEFRSNNNGVSSTLSKAVYLVNIGANDYIFPLVTNSTLLNSLTPQQYVSLVVGNITQVIREIYNQGGRKFAVVNQGALGCTPLLRARELSAGGNGSCLAVANDYARLHNELLSDELQCLKQQLPGFKYSYFDIFNAALQVAVRPLQYGFKELESACCGSGPLGSINSCGGKRGITEFELCDNPSDHFFFDAVHPTEAFNAHLSKVFWAGPSDLVGPHNLRSLFKFGV